MAKCGICVNFRKNPASEAVGRCVVITEGVSSSGIKQYKQVRYYEDASECKMFTKVENPPTDRKEQLWDPNLRSFEDFEEEKVDTRIETDKLKDEKAWG